MKDSFRRVILDGVLLVSLLEIEGDFVVFDDAVVDVVPAIASFLQSFMGHNISVKARDVSHFLQLK